MQIDYYGKPKDTLENLLAKYSLDIYLVLEDVLDSNRSYKFVYQDLLDILKLGFEIKEIRTRPIYFKFRKNDEKTYMLELRHFLSNMIFWRAFMDMERLDLLNEDAIIDFTKFNSNIMIEYIDNKILPYYNADFASKNKTVDEICYHINAISSAFSILMGMGISIYDVIQTTKRNPEMEELIFGEIDPRLQPVEIEQELNRRADRLIELFVNDAGNNDLKPLFVAGNILSKGQFKEMFVKVGFKADINGHTIPYLIDNNFIVTGLNTPSAQYISSLGGRKALILTKTSMGVPGAFSKKLNHAATSASYLRKDNEKCDSTFYVTYKILNQEFLKLLNGRYYYDERGLMRKLDYKTDEHLIGKVVNFLSPATCASTEGICRYCYGHLYDINKDMFSVGSLAATKLSEPLGQTVLSSKHQQLTNSNTIVFNQDFDKVFELISSEISLREDSDLDEELFIVFDNIKIEETEDEDLYSTTSFKIVDVKGTTIYNIAEENGANMYLSDQLLALYKKMKDKSKPISLESFDSDSDVLFTVEIKNKELTEPIKLVQKILNSNDKMGAKTLSEVCQVFAESLIQIGIKYDLVHAECIIRALLRKKSNKLEFPDWTANGDHDDYQILSLNSSLFNNPSPLVSMSYGYLRKQLISPELYEKHEASHLDPLFVSKLSKYIDQ